MKAIKSIHYLVYFVLSVFLFASCDDFLDKTPEAQVTDEDVFGTYEDFQGFLDPNYGELMDYNQTYLAQTMFLGGEIVTTYAYNEFYSDKGNYWSIIAANTSSIHYQTAAGGRGYGVGVDKSFGIWIGGWRGIRRSNVALRNLKLLVDATDEERKLIEGQALFFRAYFHGDIMANFGGMPYIDSVFSAADELKKPRLLYQEATERIVQDLDKAIALLPENWDETGPGSQRIGANTGRITKGCALAYKQKFLLYAGSPLMNGFSGNDFTYNVDFCRRAADAGWEMIKLANKGVYALVPFTNYSDIFYKNNGTQPWTTETILHRNEYRIGTGNSYNFMRRQFLATYLGGASPWNKSANQLIVDRFEMADGTPYKLAYDTDNSKRWQNRDPRFKYNFYVDRDKLGANASSVAKLFTGTDVQARPGNFYATPYIIKKFMPYNCNNFDKVYTQFLFIVPLMRLAEVYLDYAEAVTAAYGPTGTAPGSTLTAVDAINIVRARAGMPAVTAAATGYNSFMDLVWNERTVELIYESHYWFDIRRWYVAHLPEYKDLVDLQFDKNWTYFNRKLVYSRVFDNPKHYWLPIYRDQVQLYKNMYQNPGWE